MKSKSSVLKGQPVTLYVKTQTGRDDFNRPEYELTAVTVENVLIGHPSANEIKDILELTGRRVEYVLGIPKGDTHKWEGSKVGFFGETFHVIGIPVQGIEDLIPLDWNKKVMVERYGG